MNVENFKGENSLYGRAFVGNVLKQLNELQKSHDLVTMNLIIQGIQNKLGAPMNKSQVDNLKRRTRRTLNDLAKCEIIDRHEHKNEKKVTEYSYSIKWK